MNPRTVVEARGKPPGGRVDPRLDPAKEPAARGRVPRIRCPKCLWEPERDSLWMCTCLFAWNTFETGGRCPACGKQWTETCCLRCHRWSPHLDWYADDGEPEA
jgi:hypothetical protein